jgi:hypothetical protein
MASSHVTVEVTVDGKEAIEELVSTLKELKRIDRGLYRIIKNMIRVATAEDKCQS